MEKSTLISEMQKFRFASKVFCSDGEDGTLVRVSFDPSTRRMTYLGARQGRLFGKTSYLPYTSVASAASDGVYLTVTREELTNASKDEPGDISFDSRSVVEHADGRGKGSLLMVALRPESGELAYCVVHHLIPGRDTLLRHEYIKKLEAGRIVVSLSDEQLSALPPYRADNELQREVEDILFDVTPLHVDADGMDIRVLDSVLYLNGNISSGLRGDIVEDQARGVPGLLEIKNNLIGDDGLASDLAMKLAHDPRTQNLPIGVYPRLGEVRLSGAVHSNQQREAAGAIARSFPGVRSVFNNLVVDPQAALLRVMASAEGGEASDKVPGKYVRHTK